MTGKPHQFVSFEEFTISAESYGMSLPEFAKKVGVEIGDLRVVITGDGKFRFFGERGVVPCPEGFEITDELGDYVRELGVANLTIPDSVETIGNYAFSYCTSLRSVVIPNSVESIRNFAFHSCSSLKSVSIPNSVKSIGDYVFSYCTSLTSVLIPDSVTSIGNNAFYCCTSLRSISIPNSVKSIGYKAFYGCTSLVYSGHGHGH